MKFLTAYNFDFSKVKGEDCSAPSLSQPDMAYTVYELFERFANGVMPAVSKVPVFEPDPDFDNVDVTMDPAFDLSDYTTEMLSLELERRERQIERARPLQNDVSKQEPERSDGDDEK